VPAPYRGVLFDLFGTLVVFDGERLPTLEVDGRHLRTTVGALGDLIAEFVPGTAPADFLRALLSVSDEMARVRSYDHVELPSRERFRRALERVGCDDGRLAEAAVHLSRAHMACIVAATVLPPAHAALVDALRPRLRLALVSNFDDTGAAYDILQRHGLAGAFGAVVVSEALGLRKPHPALLRAALRGLDLPAEAVLFVGDTFHEDVAGAQAAGVDVAWIDAQGSGVPASAAAATYVLRALPDLAAILDGR
jgi:putative hydrolase of the HAD superfamily